MGSVEFDVTHTKKRGISNEFLLINCHMLWNVALFRSECMV